MLERLGHFLVRRRMWVVAGTVVAVLVAGGVGGNVAEHLRPGGFESPDVESERASQLLGEIFHQAPPNFLLLVEAKTGTVDDLAVRREGIAITNELGREKDITQVVSHWSLGPNSPLVSKDRTKAIIVAGIGGNDQELGDKASALKASYTRDTDTISVGVGGFGAIFEEISETIEKDLARGESIAIPITLALLIVVFGSVIAAAMPLVIGIISILGTFFILRVIASITDVSVFALSMVTAMGLGLAIDYSLFIVSRFREELRKGADTETAVVTTVRTAGRTIIFAGITVALSLASLIVFPLFFFKSFGYAGIGVVAMAVTGAVVFLPAMLAVLGPRVDKWALWRRHPKEVGQGFWHRLAVFVMRRPVWVSVVVTAFLLVLGSPFLHANVGLPDERVLPPSAETRKVHDALRNEFPSDEINSLRVVAPEIGDPQARAEDIGAYTLAISELEGVQHAESLAGVYVNGKLVQPPSPVSARFGAPNATWFQVVLSVDPASEQGEDLAHEIRDLDGPFDVLVGGSSAQLVDAKQQMFSRFPIAIALIAIATFVLLFLNFGSLLVPAKALVLNLLSLTATFGAMVWIFQDGHLSGVLDFTATGSLDLTSPILIFCIAFGLSMDYEVFLLSRIKEEYDATGDNERSVARGLERTGRIVTAAAVLISVVFLSIGASSIRFMKLFGIGMSLAVLMDAFVIRGTLVPAFMRLAGRANWWLPRFLRPLHARLNIRELHELPAPAPAPARPPGKRPASRKATPRKSTAHRTTAAKATTARRSGAKPKAKPKAKARAQTRATRRKP